MASTTETALVSETRQQTYKQILKSSIVVGGSSVANIAIGIVRAKAMALLLGPAGVGLTGLYTSIVDVTSTVAGMGVNSSGVRQIAAAVGSGDLEQIARTTVVLRRVSIVLGVLGAVILVVFSIPLSSLAFRNHEYSAAICVLSIAVFFKLVSAGQSALVQGMRRISDLAQISVWSVLFGTFATVMLVFFLREKGIVPSLVCAAAITTLISWRYSRRIEIQSPRTSLAVLRRDLGELLRLGIAFMATSVMTMGSAYVIRLVILRCEGLDGAGLYQSAWTLGGLYVNIVLQAMAADFYPRLTANANNNPECNRMVNEQSFVGLVLGGPGIIATMTFAPLVIAAFYSAKFQPAVEILRWLCLGTILQLMSWPMGFIVLAKGRQNIFLLSDLAWTIVYILSAWICIRSFGLKGAGIAFFASYVFHLMMTYPIARHLSGFRWSRENKQAALLFLLLIAIVFCGFYRLSSGVAGLVGLAAVALSGIYSTWVLATIVPEERIPRQFRPLISRVRARTYETKA